MASNDKTPTDDTVLGEGTTPTASQAASADERRMHLQAFDYWRELKGERDKPLFHQLTVDGLAPYKHYSLLVERGLLRDDGSTEITVRFFGPGLEPLFNRRPTAGDNFRDYTDSGFAEELLSLLDNRSAADRAAEFEYVDMHIDSRGVMLPLSRSGGTVDYLWVVISSKTYEEDAEDGIGMGAAEDIDAPSTSAHYAAGDGEHSMATQSLEDGAADITANTLGAEHTANTPEAKKLSEDDIEALLGGHASLDADTPPVDSDAGAVSDAEADALKAEDLDDDWAALEQAPMQPALQDPHTETGQPAEEGGVDVDADSAVKSTAGSLSESAPEGLSGDTPSDMSGDMAVDDAVDTSVAALTEASLIAARAKAAEYQQGHQAGFGQLYSLLADAMALYERADTDPNWWQNALEASGLRAQKRAPYTPPLKMVFGKDYDKTRLTEYAAALSCAARMGQTSQTLVAFLSDLPGGIKGAVQEERNARRGLQEAPQHDRLSAARKILAERPARATVPIALEDDFVLLLARKGESGADIIQIADMSDSKLSAILQQLAQKDPA